MRERREIFSEILKAVNLEVLNEEERRVCAIFWLIIVLLFSLPGDILGAPNLTTPIHKDDI